MVRGKAKAKLRPPQWNEERCGPFLQTLALHSNVAESKRQAGTMPRSTDRERCRFVGVLHGMAEGYDRLDAVGALLSSSTAALSTTVKAVAPGAKLDLLIYLPIVPDPWMCKFA
jgi:hypothetical protein